MSRLKLQDMSEFSRGWKLIFASFIGMMAGLTALPFYTYGVFAGQLEGAFGWNRAQTQSALMFQTIGVLGVLPFLGWACDKHGARRIAIISMALFAIGFAMLSQMQGALWQYYLTAFAFGILGAGTLPITWTRAINGAFEMLAHLSTESTQHLDQVLDQIGNIEGIKRTTSSIILSTKFSR